MYNKIIDQLNESLDDVFCLTEKKLSGFPIEFRDYDTFIELTDSRVKLSGNDLKWYKDLETKINTFKKNKQDFKQFETVYKKGNWR